MRWIAHVWRLWRNPANPTRVNLARILPFGHELGDLTYGAPAVRFWTSGGRLVIGPYGSIAHGVTIFLGGNHRTDRVSTYPFAALASLFPEARGLEPNTSSPGGRQLDHQPGPGQGVREVFTWRPRGARGLRPIAVDGWRKRWTAALAAAVIRDFRWHGLRRIFATRGRRAGGDILALRGMLGHEDLASMRRSAHVDAADLRQALARMEARNSPGQRRRRSARARK